MISVSLVFRPGKRHCDEQTYLLSSMLISSNPSEIASAEVDRGLVPVPRSHTLSDGVLRD